MSDEDEWVERDEPDEADAQIVIPWERLSAAALRGVIEEFVTREGTDYGPGEVSLDDKVTQVQRQLERGEVVVLFDAKSEQVNLARARELKQTRAR